MQYFIYDNKGKVHEIEAKSDADVSNIIKDNDIKATKIFNIDENKTWDVIENESISSIEKSEEDRDTGMFRVGSIVQVTIHYKIPTLLYGCLGCILDSGKYFSVIAFVNMVPSLNEISANIFYFIVKNDEVTYIGHSDRIDYPYPDEIRLAVNLDSDNIEGVNPIH